MTLTRQPPRAARMTRTQPNRATRGGTPSSVNAMRATPEIVMDTPMRVLCKQQIGYRTREQGRVFEQEEPCEVRKHNSEDESLKAECLTEVPGRVCSLQWD